LENGTLHDLIAQLGELRATKKKLAYELKLVDEAVFRKERDIMDALDDQQLTESKSAAGKVTLGEAVYPQVEDWDAFHSWILENNYLHFLEKRAAVLAYREAIGQNIAVPGVLPYTKRKITFKET
jgi:hypothetical protein